MSCPVHVSFVKVNGLLDNGGSVLLGLQNQAYTSRGLCGPGSIF